jgi:hypothetical protein
VEIRRQGSRLAYDGQEVLTQVHHWWFDKDTPPADGSPDTYWRGRHGNPVVWHHLVHVALRFVTLGASEAGVERLISIRRHVQGVTGTNYRPDTMHAQPHHARKTIGTISKRMKRIPSRIGTKAELSAVTTILVSIRRTFTRLM